MIKRCAYCGKEFEGNAKKRYCTPKCKKNFENSQRGKPKDVVSVSCLSTINRPHSLNLTAAAYWDKVAPILLSRGHLNVLSEDSFAELCDLYSRLQDINRMIDLGLEQVCDSCGVVISFPANRSLLQVEDKWDNRAGVETRSLKESGLSDLKRKYSRQFLDYCKQFYLTPLSNRGNFGLHAEEGKEQEKGGKERFF